MARGTDEVDNFRLREAGRCARPGHEPVSHTLDDFDDDGLRGSAVVAEATIVSEVSVKHGDAHTHFLLRLPVGVERHFNAAFAEARADDPFEIRLLRSESHNNRRRL